MRYPVAHSITESTDGGGDPIVAKDNFARFVQTLLFEVEPISASSLGLPVLCLIGVAFAAAWSPARRAACVDPTETLRLD
jgi:ABC-type lipoprotein release transport system permease subunit